MGSPPAVITDCVLWELGAATLAAAEVRSPYLVSGEGALGTRTQPPVRRLFPVHGGNLTPTDYVDTCHYDGGIDFINTDRPLDQSMIMK